MKVLLHQDDDLQKAHDRYHYFASDADAKARWEAHWKWQLDQNQALYDARREGRLDLARELMAGGMTAAQVAELTKIPLEQLTPED